ncbi:MAG: hypothetical protein AB3N64_01505 [Puniceicoccaceae bacterium]
MKLTNILILALFVLLVGFPVDGVAVAFFDEDEPVQFQLTAPLAQLKRQRGENPDWLEALVMTTDGNGAEITLDAKIHARGNFRRKRSSCGFPSYWMNFRKKQVRGTVFDGLNKVKVVAHCREGRRSFAPFIYREYLAYKTYNLLTDKSFRVRLAEVEYVDERGRISPRTEVAFFIEPVGIFAKRHKAKQVKERYILPDLYDPYLLSLAEMFQFMIGNTDFSFLASDGSCCHNAKAYETPEGYLPVPYDFDVTGLVDVPYARVNPTLKTKSVRDRFYRGLTTDPDIFDKVLESFMAKKEAIMELWENTPYLEGKDKTNAIAYIEEFYAIIEDPDLREKRIHKRMRNRENMTEKILTLMEEAGD